MNYILLLALCGFMVSLYGWWEEQQIAKDGAYRAACDLSNRISCSKVFKSPYAHLLGFSNVYKGMIFYALVAVLAYLQMKLALVVLTALACATSFFLAYLLIYRIKTICPICVIVYTLNGLLFLASCHWYFTG